jgi:hypothetical protein
MGAHRLQIRARGKRVASTGQDDYAGPVLGGGKYGLPQQHLRLAIDGVASFGPVKGDSLDPVLRLDE